MAQVKIRYLITRKLANGRVHYFWQPKSDYRRAGWAMRGPWTTLDAAIPACEAANAALDAWRKGLAPPATPDADAPRHQVQLVPPQRAARAAPGTLNAVIDDYMASSYYLDRAPKTRQYYRTSIRILRAWGGDEPVAALSAKTLREALYLPFAKRTPAKARALIRTLSAILAVRHLIYEPSHPAYAGPKDNPCADLRLTAEAKGTGRIWSEQAVTLFVETADAMGLWSVGTAILANYWLGQRAGDILKLPRDMAMDGVFRFTQQKTGVSIILDASVVPALIARVAEERARQKERGVIGPVLLICEATGQPYQGRWFAKQFATVRAAVANARASAPAPVPTPKV